MRHPYMVWTNNLLALMVLAFGVWLLVGHMPGLPDYKLLSGLVALTGLMLNHFRWWKLTRNLSASEIVGKVDYLMVVNYMILLFALALVDFRR